MWGKRLSRVEVEAVLRESAMREAEEVLARSGPAVAVAGSREEIEEEVKRLRRYERTGRPLGDESFIVAVERQLRRTLRRGKPCPQGSRAS